MIKEELAKLLQTGIIREVNYTNWPANPVLVKKKIGQWRICVDFTKLNRACLKDDYPLLRIDQLIDFTASCELLSFLDAYSGYHQAWMEKEDEKHTSFITHHETYCHIRMSFKLKNSGATFARLVQKVLGGQFRRNIEAYIDDIVVKSRKEREHAQDLEETFSSLRKASIRLNLEKCVFRV